MVNFDSNEVEPNQYIHHNFFHCISNGTDHSGELDLSNCTK